MALDSMKEIFERSARENIPFWEIVLQYDMEERQVSRQASMAKMLSTWQAIQDAADSYTGTQRSVSGLVGGDGLKMRLYARRGESIGGEFMDEVIVQAISMAESNACMRRIVAAPTAGSCGVVPAVLLPLCEREHYTQHELLEALYVASGIGAVIAYRASISGRGGRLPGRDRYGVGHGGGRTRVAARRHERADRPRCGNGAQKSDGPCVRPRRGPCRGPGASSATSSGAVNAISAADMTLAGIESRHPRRRGHRRDGRGRTAHAGRVPRDGARRSGRNADR